MNLALFNVYFEAVQFRNHRMLNSLMFTIHKKPGPAMDIFA